MILTLLNNADRYIAVHLGLAAAFAALRQSDLATLPDGRHEIDGDRLFLLVARGGGRGRENSPLEAHRRYIDVQYVIAGSDLIGWLPLAECRRPQADYDAARDIVFFDDRPTTWLTLNPGTLAVFFPEDAHSPLAGPAGTSVHKVVVKVAV